MLTLNLVIVIGLIGRFGRAKGESVYGLVFGVLWLAAVLSLKFQKLDVVKPLVRETLKLVVLTRYHY